MNTPKPKPKEEPPKDEPAKDGQPSTAGEEAEMKEEPKSAEAQPQQQGGSTEDMDLD